MSDDKFVLRVGYFLEWWDSPDRKPSNIAFTDERERDIAYLMEYAERNRRAR